MASHYAAEVEGYGRDLMKVELGHGIAEMTTDALRHEACLEVGHKLSLRYHDGVLDPTGLCHGDWLDGIDLSAIPAHGGGTAGQPWVDEYKNNRIVLSGFNTFKYAGVDEDVDHFFFAFRHTPLKRRMNATATNAGGYAATELAAFLDGEFADALRGQIGDRLHVVNRMLSVSDTLREWSPHTVFLPTEYEMHGAPIYAKPETGGGFQGQWPIYRHTAYKTKWYNGIRERHWLATQVAGSAAVFSQASVSGNVTGANADSIYGVAPAFCIREED